MKLHNWRLILLFVIGFTVSQLSQRGEIESIVYALAMTVGGAYLVWRPCDGMWVGFFLFAMTAQLYPVEFDELGVPVQGVFRPYIGVLAVVAVALFIGRWAKPRRRALNPPSGGARIGLPLGSLVAVLLLTLVYGYFWQVNTVDFADVIRNCSGWMTFLFFLALGYRLSPSVAENHEAFSRLCLVAFVYSPFFIGEYINVWVSEGPEPAKFFAYSQRDAVFFSAVVLAVLVAEKFSPGVKLSPRWIWLLGPVLLVAILFSGSRADLVSALLVNLSLAVFWHARSPMRVAAVGMAALVLVLLFTLLISAPLSGSQDTLATALSTRFIFNPAEDTSFLARASQLDAVAEAIRDNPVLGRGMLASYSFFDPVFGWKDTTFVDNGLGFILMKAGLLGMGVFIWFAVASLRMVHRFEVRFPREALAPLASFTFYVFFLLFAPSFFEFQYSWFIGIMMGSTISIVSGLRSGRITNAPRRSLAPAVAPYCDPSVKGCV